MTGRRNIPGTPPAVSAETRQFWDGLQRGELWVEQCPSCDHYVFPPRNVCSVCATVGLTPVRITSIGTLYSFTVNHQRWSESTDVPYALGLIEFADVPGVRIQARLQIEDVAMLRIGMPVVFDVEVGPGEQNVPSFVARP